jgi:prepilin peptidase CpaA
MTLYVQAIAVTGFTGVMTAAACEDFRRLVIPNLLPVALCGLWVVFFAAAPTLSGGLAALGCAAAVFVVGALLFACGWLGGGDVKLLSAAALWAGPAGLVPLLMFTAVIGGALGLLWLTPAGRQLIVWTRNLLSSPVSTEGGLAAPIPYGVSIAVAALIVILPPYLG